MRRKWITEDDNDEDDDVRCLDNHDNDGVDDLAKDETSDNQQTSPLLPNHQHRHHYQGIYLSKKVKAMNDSVNDLELAKSFSKSTKTA